MAIYSFHNHKCHRAHKTEEANVAKPHVSVASLLPSEEAVCVDTTITCVLVTVPVTTTTFGGLGDSISNPPRDQKEQTYPCRVDEFLIAAGACLSSCVVSRVMIVVVIVL
jgi:hypothetical protein